RLIDVHQLRGLADLDGSLVGAFLLRDHLEEGRLAGAVRADDPDDRALRDDERQVLVEDAVAVPLRDALRLDDDVAEPLARRDPDRAFLALLLAGLGHERFVRLEARLALGLPRARRLAHPLELAGDLLLLGALALLLDLEPLLLGLEPGGVVALE